MILFPFVSRKQYDLLMQQNLILNNSLLMKSNRISLFLSSQVDLQQEITRLKSENETLQLQTKQADDEKKEMEYWETKYPYAKILYKGRYIPGESNPIAIPVNVLVTPTDPVIISDLREWGLFRTGEDPETLVPKIYNKLKSMYVYEYDKKTWNIEEVWEFPFETRYKKKGDCDNWAKVYASYFIAAGVPSWRVRCVTGYIYSGQMHDTVYVYSRVSKTFHHFNSTERLYPYESIHGYPTHADAERGYDKIGIAKVLWSYNDQSGYYSFLNPTELLELKNFEILGDSHGK